MHEKSKGDIIVYMDDDDYYPSKKVSEVVYNSNFYWIKNWLKTHFNSKILPFVLINILIVLISKYFAKNNIAIFFDDIVLQSL